MPALLTRMSIRPPRTDVACPASEREASALPSSSAITKSARPPRERMPSTTCAPRWALRPEMTTCAPSAANASATARPMLLVAPVTRAVLPCSRPAMSCSHALLYPRDKSRAAGSVIRPAVRGHPDPARRHCHYAKKKMDLQVHSWSRWALAPQGPGRLILPRRAGLASGRSAAQIPDPLVERGPEVVGPAGRLENRHAALDARQKGGGPVLDVQIGRQVPGGLQGPDAGGQACLPPVHQLDHYGPGARGGAAEMEEQRPERALIALLLVTIDHHVPPLLPPVPGVQAPEIGLLVLQDLVCLVLRDGEQQLILPGGEVVEQLALAGPGARHDVVEGGSGHALLPQHHGRAFDDPVPGGPALRRQLLAHGAPPRLDQVVHSTGWR